MARVSSKTICSLKTGIDAKILRWMERQNFEW